MRKSKALPTQTIKREKKIVLGHGGIIPKTAEDITENLPDLFKKTSIGTPFLCFMDYV
jgi:hypothetical protein